MKGFEDTSMLIDDGAENAPQYDPRLEKLWENYELVGNPPKAGSVAEAKLKERCLEYASFSVGDKTNFTTKDAAYKYDLRKRQLHNEIAVMVVGQQRSGMKPSLARNIANFAIEYVTGFKDGKIDLPERIQEE